MKNGPPDLEALWNSVPAATRAFDPQDVADRPDDVRAYLAHSIEAGAPLASAVRLRMHGSIKLKHWRRFRAEQVIVRGRGMIWRARIRMRGLPIRGCDRFLDGEGAMRWKLMGFIPLVHASGPDVTRSTAGRVAAESIWLPSAFCDNDVWWRPGGTGSAHARFAIDGHAAELAFAIDQGRVQSVALSRWGNPDGGPFREVCFGCFVDQEATFGGYTIPARMRVGWYVDDPARFDREGKFIELSVDEAVYR